MKVLNTLSRWALHLIGSAQIVAAVVFIWLDPTRQPSTASHHPFTQADVVLPGKALGTFDFQTINSSIRADDRADNDSLTALSPLLATCPEAAPANRFFNESADGQRTKDPHFTPEPVGQNH